MNNKNKKNIVYNKYNIRCVGYACPPYTKAKYELYWLVSHTGITPTKHKRKYCEKCKNIAMEALIRSDDKKVLQHRRIQ